MRLTSVNWSCKLTASGRGASTGPVMLLLGAGWMHRGLGGKRRSNKRLGGFWLPSEDAMGLLDWLCRPAGTLDSGQAAVVAPVDGERAEWQGHRPGGGISGERWGTPGLAFESFVASEVSEKHSVLHLNFRPSTILPKFLPWMKHQS